MKDKTKLLGIITLILIIGFGMMACSNSSGGGDGGGDGVCTHDWGSDNIIFHATCTDDGEKEQTCSICGDTQTVPIPSAEAHDWKNIETHPATCLDAASIDQECLLCHDTQTITQGNALWHTWNWATYPTASNGHVDCTRVVNAIPCPGGIARIGELGQAGGRIFYVSESGFTFYQNAAGTEVVNRHYLEVNSTSAGTSYSWTTETELIAGLSTAATGVGSDIDWAIGRGMQNTKIIIDRGPVATPYTYRTPAATYCAGLTTGGKNDWFLPSKDELAEMHKESIVPGTDPVTRRTGFPTSGNYWTSSQYNAANAWVQSMSAAGATSNIGKTNANSGGCNIRAIRAF